MKKYLAKLHYKKNYNLIEQLFVIMLAAFSMPYQLITALRLLLYKLNLLKSVKVNAYVISVGNITTGGTGKTPLTAEIANYITHTLEKKVAIISRGYGGKLSSKNTNLISNRAVILQNAQDAGEEPFWLASNCHGTIVITGKDRIKSADKAINDFNCEVLILDDGFQHLRIQRDLNIAVVDCENKFGNRYLLPAGPLRESLSQLKRADAFIITDKYQNSAECESFKQELEKKLGKQTYISPFKPYRIYNIMTQKDLSYNVNSVLAFCGIGQPDSFFNFIEQLEINVKERIVFADHHAYNQDDVAFIEKKFNEAGASAIVTTEKDAVKLANLYLNIPVYALNIRPEIDLANLLKDLKNDGK